MLHFCVKLVPAASAHMSAARVSALLLAALRSVEAFQLHGLGAEQQLSIVAVSPHALDVNACIARCSIINNGKRSIWEKMDFSKIANIIYIILHIFLILF